MKYLLLVAIVLAVLWLARSGQRTLTRRDAPPKPLPEDVIACAHCGIHLPRSEAVLGRSGMFCGEAHRSAFERTHS